MELTNEMARGVAQVLENVLRNGQSEDFQNALITEYQVLGQSDFNKIVDILKQMNEMDQKECLCLPQLEIHKDGLFGFGNVDQIVVKASKKQEVFETVEHRHKELQEPADSLSRVVANFFAGDWMNSQPDYQKNSTELIGEFSGPSTTNEQERTCDFIEGDRVQDVFTKEQLQQIRDQLPRLY